MKISNIARGSLIIGGLLASSSTIAMAQNAGATAAQPQSGLEDIVVTARKRDESSIAVPVVMTAVGANELSRRSVTNLDGIARIVPQLIIAPQNGSVQGGNIALRGISGPDSNPFGDQAVSFNIDGVQIAKASVRRMSDTDLAQVEVLKGPQALFYGKNSPGGVVSLRTADPTNTFQAKVTGGYEFNADELRLEGYVSGPVTDTLGVRVAGYYSRMQGDLHNEVPNGAYLYPDEQRLPHNRDYAVRGTVKWEPAENFNARLKVNLARTKYAGPAQAGEFVSCPFGSPQSGSVDNCKADNKLIRGSMGPVVGTLDPTFKDGEPYGHQRQILTGLELNYSPSDEVKLTSITGYYDVNLIQAENYEDDYSIALPSRNIYKDKEFSQELRVQTDYDGPLNFTAGTYLGITKAETGSKTFVFAGEASGLASLAANGLGFVPLRTPFQINNYYFVQKGTAYSAFLQMSYKPIEKIEITAGGRYSYEKKHLSKVLNGSDLGFGPGLGTLPSTPVTNTFDNMDDVTSQLLVRKGNWKDFSPEISVSYRPNQDLTVFGNYKHGFLSGGFNSSSVDNIATTDLSYDPQTIKGFEAGLKAALFNRTLRVNMAAYTYKVSDLQVVNFTNASSTIRNAASTKIKGAEMDFNYRTPLDGLSVHGAAAYNRGRYSSFPNAPCYNGQTPAEGCTLNASNVPVQDLSGAEIPRAPKWNLSGGFGYETPLTDAMKLGLSVDANYSSSFLTDSTSAPDGRMPKYALLDASLRVSEADDRWEVALVGRNLTNKYYYVASTDVPFTGSGTGTVAGVRGDRFAAVSRGREVMIRLSYKFGQ
nr:TonB-dependent receptor [Sphingomonas sp. CDS-1]